MVLSKAYSKLNQIRQQKLYVKRAIKNASQQMRPGWYAVDGFFGYRLGSIADKNLRTVKGYSISSARNLLERGIIRLAYISCPPIFFYLRGAKNAGGEKLLVTASGSLKVFDYTRKIVISTLDSPDEKKRLLESNKLLSSMSICTKLQSLPDPLGVVEPLYCGTYLSHMRTQDQLNWINKIADHYELFFRSQSPTYKPAAHFFQLFDDALDLPLPRLTAELITERRQCLVKQMEQCPFFACHGDLHGENILIVDGEIKILDFDTVSEQPFFFDFCTLIFNQAQLGKIQLCDDAFSGPLDSLCESAVMHDIELSRVDMFTVYVAIAVTKACAGIQKNQIERRVFNIAKPMEALIEKNLNLV